MRRSIYLTILFIILTNYVQSAHIIGGKFRITYIGNNTIKVQLELERDCLGGGASFETNAIVGIYSKTTNIKVDEIILKRDLIVSSPFNYDCNGESRCVEQGYFSSIYNSFNINSSDSDGYYLHWERCCLTNQLTNIIDPSTTPFSALIDIPRFTVGPSDTINFINSSPFKNEIFNPLICLNSDFEYNFGFVDPDGDSLVYEIITPIAGGYTSQFDPAQANGPKPYDMIFWANGFNNTDFIPSLTPLSLDSRTGILKFKPSQLGKYLFAIAVHEYRNGNKIGTVYYESILYTYNCNSAVISQPKNQYSINHSPVTFHVKHSDSSVTYQWQYRASINNSFVNIQKANNDSLTIQNVVDSMNNYQYRCVMYKSGCNDYSSAALLLVVNTGIEHSSRTQLTLFPNPTNNMVSIKGIENPHSISVYSLEGKLLKEIFNANTIDVSDILPGMYLVRVTDEQNHSNYYGKLRIGE